MLLERQLRSGEDSKQQDATLQTSLQKSLELEKAHSAAKSDGGGGRLTTAVETASGGGGAGAQYGA